MKRFKTMQPDIYECWCTVYKSRTDSLLEQVKVVLLELAEELIDQDIPGILPYVYRIYGKDGRPIPAPILARKELPKVADPQLISQLKKVHKNWIRQLPDVEFSAIMGDWLKSKSREDQRLVLKACLQQMDVQASSKVFRFTVVDQDPILPQLANAKYGLSESELISNLEKLSLVRNALNHFNEEGRHNLEPDLHYGNLEMLIQQLQQCSGAPFFQKIADCRKQLLENKAALTLAPLAIGYLEDQYGFPQGTLGKKLKENVLCKGSVNESATVLIAIREMDIAPVLHYFKESERVVQETGKGAAVSMLKKLAPAAVLPASLKLPAYTAGKFSTAQLSYFVDHFSLLADVATLMSKEGLALIANVLLPVLAERKKRLQIDWSTLVHIYSMEKNASDASVREIAKKARMQIYHLQHMGYVRYVGSAYSDPDPRESLMQLLKDNREEPICVITPDRELVARINTEGTPFVLCLGLWGSRGFALRSECAQRYADFGLVPRQEPESLEEENEPEEADTSAPAAPKQPAMDAAPETPKEAPGKTDISASFPEVVPEAHDTVWDENGTKLMLSKVKGQPGGEGTVYTTNRPGQMAKIYHANKLTKERQDKLTAMRKIPLELDSVCWPTSLLYNEQHQFVGFLMQAAPNDAEELGSSVMKLGGKSMSQEKMPNWDRQSIVECAISLCKTFEQLHRNNILMGDVNPRNIMVSLSDPGKVYFVDCDSYQVGSFNCPVGMTEYSSPEILRRVSATPGGYAACPRTMQDENFALATLLFKMLMLGQTPFAAKNAGNRMEAVRDYSFAFKSENITGYDAPDGPAPLIWSNTPKHLKDKFAQVFLGQQTYDAALWAKEFWYYLKKLEDGTYTKLLRPIKYPDFTGDLFVDFTCIHCGAEANMTKEQFKKLEDQPKFCRPCLTTVRRSRNIPQKVRCDACGQQRDGFVYDQIMKDFGKKWYCGTCRTATCVNCGKSFTLSPKNIERRRQGNLNNPWCYDCYKKR